MQTATISRKIGIGEGRMARKAFSSPAKTLEAVKAAAAHQDLATIQAAIHPETPHRKLDFFRQGCASCPEVKRLLGAWKTQMYGLGLGTKYHDVGCERSYGLIGYIARAGGKVGVGDVTFHKRQGEWLIKSLSCTTITM